MGLIWKRIISLAHMPKKMLDEKIIDKYMDMYIYIGQSLATKLIVA